MCPHATTLYRGFTVNTFLTLSVTEIRRATSPSRIRLCEFLNVACVGAFSCNIAMWILSSYDVDSAASLYPVLKFALSCFIADEQFVHITAIVGTTMLNLHIMLVLGPICNIMGVFACQLLTWTTVVLSHFR